MSWPQDNGSTLGIWDVQNPSNPILVQSVALPHGLRRLKIAVPTPQAPPAASPAAILDGAGPNPFNPMTDVSFRLAPDAKVRLLAFAVAGRCVGTLTEGERAADQHEVRFAPNRLASGTYLRRLEAAGQVETRKITLVR